MPSKAPSPERPADEIVRDTSRLLKSMSAALKRVVARLNRDGAAGADPKDTQRAIAEYKKLLGIVLALEGNLARRRAELAASNPEATLDLDAARAEIDARLDQLRREAGDGPVS
jgi:hypothetical protein